MGFVTPFPEATKLIEACDFRIPTPEPQRTAT
jgi:hypothetical protein